MTEQTAGMVQCSDPAYDRLRRHLIEHHGYSDDYFDEDYPIGGPIRELSTLRWLHAPHVKSREYPKGCERDG